MSALYGSLLLLNLALAPPQRRELLAEAAARRICFAIGPIRDRARALEISERYLARQVRTELKSSLDKLYLGVMVYVDGHETRADAAGTGATLAAHGIRDQVILNPESGRYLLSLGIFGHRRNAERLKVRVEGYGFPARIEERYRERTVYFVFAEQSDGGGLIDLLDGRDLADGVDRFSVPCRPAAENARCRVPGCGARQPGETGIASIFPVPRSARPPVQPRRRFI